MRWRGHCTRRARATKGIPYIPAYIPDCIPQLCRLVSSSTTWIRVYKLTTAIRRITSEFLLLSRHTTLRKGEKHKKRDCRIRPWALNRTASKAVSYFGKRSSLEDFGGGADRTGTSVHIVRRLCSDADGRRLGKRSCALAPRLTANSHLRCWLDLMQT